MEQKPGRIWKFALAAGASLLSGAGFVYSCTSVATPVNRSPKEYVQKKSDLDTPFLVQNTKQAVVPELSHITFKSIEELLKKDKVVIDVCATWCGPCKAYAIPFAQASAKYCGNGIYFADMDFDDNAGTILELIERQVLKDDVRSIPCTIFLKDGKEIDRFIGGDAKALEEKINQYFSTRK